MNQENQSARIDRLEMLLSEHEYTVETLNTIVSEQTQQIGRLNAHLDLLKHQIKELKSHLPQSTPVDEKPPHY